MACHANAHPSCNHLFGIAIYVGRDRRVTRDCQRRAVTAITFDPTTRVPRTCCRSMMAACSRSTPEQGTEPRHLYDWRSRVGVASGWLPLSLTPVGAYHVGEVAAGRYLYEMHAGEPTELNHAAHR